MSKNIDIQQIKQRYHIIGNNEQLFRAIDIALQVAPTDLSVLIQGESGVGKEIFPQIIHQNGPRKHGSYIAVNCGAIPEGTIDSELFGHEKGAFTGALTDRKGYFEVADGGTLFLDEVGELPLATQARLLRVLETGEFIRVGASKVQTTNVRIVAATNVNMTKAIQEAKFREDLYYRLNTVPISVPPLRNRGEDILLLFRKFANDFATKYRMPIIQLSEKAKLLLLTYRFPGNIRQLRNITEQMSIIEPEREISVEKLKLYLPDIEQSQLPALLGNKSHERTFGSEREILYQVLFDMKKDMNDLKQLVNELMSGNTPENRPFNASDFDILHPNTYTPTNEIVRPRSPISVQKSSAPVTDIEPMDDFEEESLSLEEMEREMIRKALVRHNGKRRNAAQELKISERTLYRKIKELGLE